MPEDKTQSRSRTRSQTADDDGDDAATATAPAGTDDGGSGNDTPPKAEQSDEAYELDTLTRRSDSLLGVPAALATGVLREHEGTITINEAKAKIQDYLDNPVVAEEG